MDTCVYIYIYRYVIKHIYIYRYVYLSIYLFTCWLIYSLIMYLLIYFRERLSEGSFQKKSAICSHTHIISSSHLHIFSSSHLYILTSSHLHIFTHLPSISLSPSLLPSVTVPLLLVFSLLRQQAVLTRRHDMATLSHEMRFECQKLKFFFAILHLRRQSFGRKWGSSVKNWGFRVKAFVCKSVCM